jgi:5-hydroxyisourate hydrolase
MACLTTHVLDTARGKPAAGLKIRLYAIKGNRRELLKSVVTNDDGRTRDPLLEDEDLRAGVYELVFSADDYYRVQRQRTNAFPFLGEVVVRFGISNPTRDHHVPLLLAPYGYSTYRGS